jgi:hypothetical protein
LLVRDALPTARVIAGLPILLLAPGSTRSNG